MIEWVTHHITGSGKQRRFRRVEEVGIAELRFLAAAGCSRADGVRDGVILGGAFSSCSYWVSMAKPAVQGGEWCMTEATIM
jgi:hypothetical protein